MELMNAHRCLATRAARAFERTLVRLDPALEFSDLQALCMEELALRVIPSYDGRIAFRSWAIIRLRGRLLSELRLRQRRERYLGRYADEPAEFGRALLLEMGEDAERLLVQALEEGTVAPRAARLLRMRLAGATDAQMLEAMAKETGSKAHKEQLYRHLRRATDVLCGMAAEDGHAN